MNVRDTLLLACGSADSRGDLRSIFEDSFNLLEAANSHQALMLLEQNHSCIAGILIDATISEKIDITVVTKIETLSQAEEIPVLLIAEKGSSEDFIANAFERGAADVFFSNYDPFVLARRVHNTVELYRHKWHLEELVEEQAAILRNSNDTMIDALSSIIEYRSAESGQHILRIRRFTQILLTEVARNCPEYGLTEATISIISSASALHDIGKISIPDAILNKPGKLTAEEWEIMKGHALTGCSILETLGDIGNPEYLRYAHNICHYHHERWNGGGYPEGLVGDDIPICAQVVGLADAYDALTSKRVYKEAFSFEKSINMIVNGECGVFSPKLLECFKGVANQFEDLAIAYTDGLSPKTETFDVTLPSPVHRKGLDTLHNVQSKFQTLLHYINGTAAEVDLDQQIFHLIYNPYLELTPLSNSTSFADAQRFLHSIILPEEQESFLDFLHEDVPFFLKSGTRKQIHYFHTVASGREGSNLYQVTLLRPDPEDDARKFIIIWQKILSSGFTSSISTKQPDAFPLDMAKSLVPCLITYRNDKWHTLESVSGDISTLTGYTEEEIKTLFEGRLIELVLPEDHKRVRQILSEHLENSNYTELTYRLRHKDGRSIWVLNKSYLSIGEDGKEYFCALLTDVTKSKKTQNKLQLNLQQYESIFAYTKNVLFDWDIINDTISFSDQWYEIFGYLPMREKLLANLPTKSHFHPEDIPLLYEMVHNMKNGAKQQLIEVRIAKADGRYLWTRHQATALHNEAGKLLKITGIIMDIDEEKRAAKELQDRAERDSLTKLLNKHTARKQAEDYLSSFPQGANCAMLIIDLDNFKNVNDRYGHMFGDTVLTQAAREIKKLFRAQDLVARIGGDEFMVLMRGISDRQLIQSRCSRLVSVFQNIFRNQIADCNLGCSIGVALSPEHGTTYIELFKHADQALYQVKADGKNGFMFYDSKNVDFRTPQKTATAVNEHIDSDETPELSINNIVQYTFSRLYESGDVENALQDVLALVGQQMNVSRVYVFENSADNKYCSNTFEWCNTGVEPEIENLQNISYEEDIPNFLDSFNEEGVFYCSDVSTLTTDLRDILEPQGIKSIVHCLIRDNGVFRGYVGFDDCVNKRMWTKDQINVLSFFSEMLSTFLLKKRAQDETTRWAKDLRSILDNQNAWIYVIDPETCELKFLNEKTKELAPDVETGMHCYKGLMGREDRCPGCPAKNILKEKTAEQVMYNQQFGLRILSEATLIQWENENACLMTCTQLKKEVF